MINGGVNINPTWTANNSRITDTPQEGLARAIKMSRRVFEAAQPDKAARNQMRVVYANDAGMLLQVGQVVATESGTITAANNYWRKT